MSDIVEKLRDRDAVVVGGLFHAIPVMREAAVEIERLRLFLREIAAMGPADEEWDADTLESAIELAKRALTTP